MGHNAMQFFQFLIAYTSHFTSTSHTRRSSEDVIALSRYYLLRKLRQASIITSDLSRGIGSFFKTPAGVARANKVCTLVKAVVKSTGFDRINQSFDD